MRKNGFNIILYFVMLFSVAILIYGCSGDEQEEERLTAIEVVEAETGDISQWVTMTSRLKPVENVMVFTKTPGLTVTSVNVNLGDRVKEGDLLFELDKSVVRQQVEHTKANYDMAKENYNKQKELFENQQMVVEELQVMSSSRSLSRLVQANKSFQIPSMQDNAEASLATARAQVDQMKMAYATSLRQLNELDYYAPIDGVVSQLNVYENQIALNQQPALVITNTEMLKSEVFISEKLLEEIKINKDINVDIGGDSIIGKVSLINSVADPRTNLYLVEILINNTNNELKVGSFNKVRFEAAKRENVIVIPKDALLFEGEDTFVFIEENSRVHKRKIYYGIDQGDFIEIVSGLNEGERVVTKGQQYLKDEMQVQVVRGVKNENI